MAANGITPLKQSLAAFAVRAQALFSHLQEELNLNFLAKISRVVRQREIQPHWCCQAGQV